MIKTGIRAVVFDRDGTLIEHVPYVSDPEEVRLLEGVRAGLRTLRDHDISMFIHTNQSGVGRGLFNIETVQQCNQRMLALIGLGESIFDGICIAPEHPDETPRYRKPSPRYARELSQRLGVSPSSICYVGDRASDLMTAAAAGTQGVGVRTGLMNLDEELGKMGLTGKFPICDGFEEVVKHLLDERDV